MKKQLVNNLYSTTKWLSLSVSLCLSVAGHNSLYDKEVLQMLALVVGVVMQHAVSNKIKIFYLQHTKSKLFRGTGSGNKVSVPWNDGLKDMY